MALSGEALQKPRPWDSPFAVGACMCACVAAYAVYLALPLILGALSDLYHFSNREIGWVGAAENAGLLFGSLLVSVRASSGRYRQLIAGGILIAMAGNALTACVHDYPTVAALRLVTGFGSGVCYSAGIACLSLMRNSSRHFSVFIVILVLANSAELWLVPGVLAQIGVRGLYLLFGAAFVAPLALLRALPAVTRGAAAKLPSGASGTRATPPVLAWGCLVAIVLFNVPASAFWAYSERIGASIGMSAQAVANTLTLCNLFSLTGSVFAYWLSLRWGQHRPQLVVIALMSAVFVFWSFGITPAGYIVGVLIFFEIWSMTQVYQLGTLNGIDGQGRYVALVPAAQGLGQSAGPFIGGLLLGWGFGFSQLIGALLLFIGGCFAAYFAVYRRLRLLDPDARP